MINRLTRRRLLSSSLALGAIAVAACASLRAPDASSTSGRAQKSMTFMAGYKPQANVSFVGVYVANELGYFKQEQLDVTIKHSSGQGEHITLLGGKQVHVVTATAADLIKSQTEAGVPMVSLAVLTQTGDQALVSLKTSGIDEPKKFEGKIVGYKVYPSFEYLATLRAANVDRSKITEVGVGFDPRILTEGKIDVLPVFRSNEPDVLRHLGFDVNIIDPAKYGVLVLGQLWVTHRDLLATDPDLYERFVRSALKGLYYAFENPKEAIDIVMKYAPSEDRTHQEYMLGVEKDMALTEVTRTRGLGWQTRDQWARLQDGLAEFGLIKTKVDASAFFTDAILNRVYKDGKLVWP